MAHFLKNGQQLRDANSLLGILVSLWCIEVGTALLFKDFLMAQYT